MATDRVKYQGEDVGKKLHRDELPFSFIRRQFPVRLAFTVNINTGQGQENERVAIYLPATVAFIGIPNLHQRKLILLEENTIQLYKNV